MRKKKLITSALPYVNNAPHLGNIIGCVLSADIFARYCRAQQYETLYICATDEYGTATENKARAEGLTPREICDKYHVIHRDVYQHFNISFDHFGRTSYPEHTEVTQSIFKDLDDQGKIEEKETDQTYCEHDKMFLADRYVTGVCPSCGFDDARGDQCDRCGKLLQPTELIDPKCQICGNNPTNKSTKHLYIKLPELEQALTKFHERSIGDGKWSNNAISVTRSWLERGLMSRPITRDLKWGIPVPKAGYEKKVFYVWFDAPIGYISTTKRALPDTWKDWWLDPDHTELYQFMAKDNIPFHTVVFPATLIGSGRKWTLLHHINATEYLNYENEKFSKSRNTGVFGTDVKTMDIPIDLWRFYLLHNRPEKSDSNFSWETFLEDVNSNFIDNIGNLLNRVFTFYVRHFDSDLNPATFSKNQNEFLNRIKREETAIVELFEEVKLREALKRILSLSRAGNKFFQDEQPWRTIKTDPEQTRATLTVLIFLARDLGILLSPYMPDTSSRILKMTGSPSNNFKELGMWETIKRIPTDKPEILFNKLQAATINSYKNRFSGKRSQEDDPLSVWKEVQIKVGQIKRVSKHPSADLLYVEEVDCGEDKMRTIVSGLVNHFSEEWLTEKKVLIATNLKSVNLRGVVSEGMLLTAERKKCLEVIDAGNAAVGTPVMLDGEKSHATSGEIDIDRFMSAKLTVRDHTVQILDKNLLINGKPIRTKEIERGKVK